MNDATTSVPVRWAFAQTRRSSIGVRLDPALHGGGHGAGARLVACQEAGDHTTPVRLGAVLTDLPLADQLGDRDLDADDAVEQPVDEVLRCIGDLPRQRLVGL